MKKLAKLLGSRLAVTGALILIQIGWLMLFFLSLMDHVAWLGVLFTVLSVAMAMYIVNKEDNPAYKIVWILLIALFPLLGGPMYLLLGNKRPARKLRARLEKERGRTRPLLAQSDDIISKLAARDARVAGTSRYIAGQGCCPVWTGTLTRYYPLGDDMFPDMITDLEAAKHYIFLEYFILCDGEMWGRILNVLERKVLEGVDVRLMYDDMGSLTKLPVDFPKQMEQKGIKCVSFNRFVPLVSLVMNNRDHRKILVVDGFVGYTGGVNLADEYINRLVKFGHWKDSAVRLEGEAVWNLTVMFLEMWNAFRGADANYDLFRPHCHHSAPFESDGFVQPFGDTPLDNEPLSENVYIDLLAQASDYVYIFTPYLLIDNEMQTALCVAARRGVDIKLFTPGIPDKKLVYQLTRSYYPPLLRAGVSIYEYTPGFLHSKSFVVDDRLAVVGTINLDYRSLYLHFECGVFFYNSSCVAELKRDVLTTLPKCHQVGLEDCRQGLIGGLLNAVLRLFAPLL